MGKLFPHPMGVFCTHLEPPKSHIDQNRQVDRFVVEPPNLQPVRNRRLAMTRVFIKRCRLTITPGILAWA